MTHDELEVEVRQLREQVAELTRIVVADPAADAPEEPASLEAQHGAFAARLKEKRR